MTRVRYKNVNGLLVSNEILMGTSLVQVKLNPETLNYIIVDLTNTYYNGNANNLQSLKRSAKQALKELGANFKDEIRSKQKKLDMHENKG